MLIPKKDNQTAVFLWKTEDGIEHSLSGTVSELSKESELIGDQSYIILKKYDIEWTNLSPNSGFVYMASKTLIEEIIIPSNRLVMLRYKIVS